MKKVFLVLLCAGLFVACGNKNAQQEPAVDTVATEVVEEAPVVEEQPVAEPVVEEQAAPKKATTTTTKKPTVKEHAQAAAENVANAAINKAESEATQAVTSTPTKKRR